MTEYIRRGFISSILDDFAEKVNLNLTADAEHYLAKVVVQGVLFQMSRQFNYLMKAENKAFIVDQLVKMDLKNDILALFSAENRMQDKIKNHMNSFKNLMVTY